MPYPETEAEVNEAATLNKQLNRLFLSGFLHPSTYLEDAFIVAERIAQLINADGDDTSLNFLTLEQLSCYLQPNGKWAASFCTAIADNPEWHESHSIAQYPHTARAATPQLAIARAAITLVPLLLPFVGK